MSVKKIKTFIIFVLLILFWSLFFGTFKLYFWSIFASGIHPSLESIAGYLSFGGIFAYLLGGALAESFYKRSLIIGCSIGALILLALAVFFGTTSMFIFAPIVMGVWFFYSLWAVIKNILISVEIHRTGYPDAVITGIVNIVFIVFVIGGVVLGPILAARFGLVWSVVLAALLVITCMLALFLDYEPAWHLREMMYEGVQIFFKRKGASIKTTLHHSLPEIKKTIRKYGVVILAITLLWAITTIVSQKSVEISKEIFMKSESQASLLLLYSSIGAILGNIVSMAFQKRRWLYFTITNAVFAILILAFPSVIEFSLKTGMYNALIALAIGMGIFFGAASNLLEGYYFKKLYDDNEKEYGAATYGLALSVILTVMMLGSSIVTSFIGHEWVLYAVGILVVIVGLFIEFAVPEKQKT